LMSNRRFNLGMITLLAVVVLSCTAVSFAQDSQLGNVSKGKLLYEENFSTSKGGSWSGSVNANFSRGYQNGSYEMIVVPMNSWRSVSTGNDYGDIILEVEATQVAGPNDNAYGVLVRKVDWNNYYNFLISGDGYYEIARLQNNSWSSARWNKSSAIKTGLVTNLISVVCQGDKFAFYVNGELLQEYTDSAFASGQIGLTAGTNYALGPVTIDFDNIKIWEIKK
jgi:hypothetical protein